MLILHKSSNSINPCRFNMLCNFCIIISTSFATQLFHIASGEISIVSMTGLKWSDVQFCTLHVHLIFIQFKPSISPSSPVNRYLSYKTGNLICYISTYSNHMATQSFISYKLELDWMTASK